MQRTPADEAERARPPGDDGAVDHRMGRPQLVTRLFRFGSVTWMPLSDNPAERSPWASEAAG